MILFEWDLRKGYVRPISCWPANPQTKKFWYESSKNKKDSRFADPYGQQEREQIEKELSDIKSRTYSIQGVLES